MAAKKEKEEFNDRIFYIKGRTRDGYNYDEVIFTDSDFLDRMEYFKADGYNYYTKVKIYFKKTGYVYTYKIPSQYIWERDLKFAKQPKIAKGFLTINKDKYINKEKYKTPETIISKCFDFVKKIIDK